MENMRLNANEGSVDKAYIYRPVSLNLIFFHHFSSVGSEPKLGSTRFWLELLGKKLGSACHAFQKARLDSPYLAKKLGSAQLALWFKNPSYLKKTKNELISNIFANFLRYNPDDISKSVFFLLEVVFSKKVNWK